MLVLSNASWYFSMNAGSDCESEILGVFSNKDTLDKYLKQNNITEEMFDYNKYYGVDDDDDDKSWYFIKEVLVDELSDNF